MFDCFTSALYALDERFNKLQNKKVPDGMSREDFYGHKHKMSEVENNQVKVCHFGLCCEMLSGVPGGMSDSVAGEFMCANQGNQEVLVDAGYY